MSKKRQKTRDDHPVSMAARETGGWTMPNYARLSKDRRDTTGEETERATRKSTRAGQSPEQGARENLRETDRLQARAGYIATKREAPRSNTDYWTRGSGSGRKAKRKTLRKGSR